MLEFPNNIALQSMKIAIVITQHIKCHENFGNTQVDVDFITVTQHIKYYENLLNTLVT